VLGRFVHRVWRTRAAVLRGQYLRLRQRLLRQHMHTVRWTDAAVLWRKRLQQRCDLQRIEPVRRMRYAGIAVLRVEFVPGRRDLRRVEPVRVVRWVRSTVLHGDDVREFESALHGRDERNVYALWCLRAAVLRIVALRCGADV
jgi:hypothetical protein